MKFVMGQFLVPVLTLLALLLGACMDGITDGAITAVQPPGIRPQELQAAGSPENLPQLTFFADFKPLAVRNIGQRNKERITVETLHHVTARPVNGNNSQWFTICNGELDTTANTLICRILPAGAYQMAELYQSDIRDYDFKITGENGSTYFGTNLFTVSPDIIGPGTDSSTDTDSVSEVAQDSGEHAGVDTSPIDTSTEKWETDPPNGQITIPQENAAPLYDGHIDDLWGLRYPLARSDGTCNASTGTVRFMSCWDDNGLYFFVTVPNADLVVRPDDSADIADYDAVAIYLNVDPLGEFGASFTDTDGEDNWFIFAADAKDESDIKMYTDMALDDWFIRRGFGEYALEMGVSFEALNYDPGAADTIHFDIVVHDVDGDGNDCYKYFRHNQVTDLDSNQMGYLYMPSRTP